MKLVGEVPTDFVPVIGEIVRKLREELNTFIVIRANRLKNIHTIARVELLPARDSDIDIILEELADYNIPSTSFRVVDE